MTQTTPRTKKPKKEKKTKQEAQLQRQRFSKKIKKRRQMPKGEFGGMRLLLIEDVPHLGNQGDVVEVKPGYGRNFLIPQGLATFVSPQALIRMEEHKAKVEAVLLTKMADLKVLAKKLESLSITIEANANEEGHLYGSVTGADIARTLREQDFPISDSHVHLEGPLKELGLYQVNLKLHEDIERELKVWVVPAGDPTEG